MTLAAVSGRIMSAGVCQKIVKVAKSGLFLLPPLAHGPSVVGPLNIGDDHLHLQVLLERAGLQSKPLEASLIFGDSITTDGLSLHVQQEMTLEQWSEAVELVATLEACSPWWTGDLLAMGERAFGEKYAQGIPDDLSPTTLRGYQWVAERVPPANRRPSLSWSHHRAVSALPPAEQSSLLDQAESDGWSVRELAQRAKGQEPQAQEKARVFKVELIDSADASALMDGEVFPYSFEDQEEIADRLRAGKRVTLEL